MAPVPLCTNENKVADMSGRGCAGAGVLLAAVAGTAVAAADLEMEARNKVALRASPFAPHEVRLLDGPFRDAQERNRRVLLALDPDRLLQQFRETAGLPTVAKVYGGWEDPRRELRGHTLGHYLSACAWMHAATGDEELGRRIDAIVAELAACQAAMPAKGYREGFLSAYPEEFFDRVYARKPVWAPYYTLHKIMAGLLDAHRLRGNAQALEVVTRMAGWIRTRVDLAGPAAQQAQLDTEFGGMNEVLANLHAATGNPDHLALARAFDHRRVFDPLAAGEDRLDGLHANTQIPKFVGAAREYELTGDEACRRIASFAWERVALHRSYAVGGHSDREHFFAVDRFADHLAPLTCETCNTYNMLKLTRHIFAWGPDARVMDFHERALVNHILAAQDPRTGMFVYFLPLKPGHYKNYSMPEDSFWCCFGTGMENPGRYGDSIWFRDASSLYLNLPIASELTWKEKGLAVRIDSRYPEDGAARLAFTCAKPVRLALKLRWPSWAVPAMSVAVNGEAQRIDGAPGSYVTIDREWRSGDIVDLGLPMSLRVEPLPGTNGWAALAYGPMVLAGRLGTNGMPDVYIRNQTEHQNIPAPEVPVLVAARDDLLRRVEPVPGEPLTFRTKGIGRPADVTLIPIHRLHHERMSVYWEVLDEVAWMRREASRAAAERERMAIEARILDEFNPGEQQSETDHEFRGERTRTGTHRERKWRDAFDGGWFEFRMKVERARPATLVCTYWGSDGGNREFNVTVDGGKIASQKLEKCKPGEFFDVEYAIPAKLTEGEDAVVVRLAAKPGAMAGGLFRARTLRATAATPGAARK